MWPLKSDQSDHKMESAPHLLAVLGNAAATEIAKELALSQGWHLTLASAVEEGRARLNENVAVVLVDRDLSGLDWRSTVRDFAQEAASPCVILASPVIDHYLFEEVVKQGGFDVVSKPLNADELRRTTLLALKFRERRWIRAR